MIADDDGLVVVPDLVGMLVEEARSVADGVGGLVLTTGDPDGPPLDVLTWSGVWEVTAQRPAAGAAVERGSAVVIAFRRRDGGGGESGDREPRVPEPPVGSLFVELDVPEPSRG